MNVNITKIFTFDAAHRLPNHDGKCARPHGHTYKLEVTVAGEPHPVDGSSGEGMVMDFADLKKVVQKNILDRFDHQDLNQVCDFVTTAENLAVYIFEQLQSELPGLTRIKLWETPTSFAEVGN